MKKILYASILFFLPFIIFSNIFTATTWEEFNLKGKVKKISKIINGDYEEVYFFDELENIIKIKSYNGGIFIKSYEYIYNNGKLEALTINSIGSNSYDMFTYKYNEEEKLVEVYKEENHDDINQKYIFDYDKENYNQTKCSVYNENKISNDSIYDGYSICKYADSKLINILEAYRYSSRNDLLSTEIYKYNENNFFKEVSYKGGFDIKNKIFLYEYKYDEKGNIVEEKEYIKIGKKAKRILNKIEIEYIYYK